MSIILDKGERSSSTDVHRCWSRVFQDTSSESFQKSLEQSTGTKEIIVFKGSLAVRVPRPCCPLRCHSVQTAGKNHNCSHLFQDISHRYLFTTITTGTDGLDICHHLPFPRCLSVVALQVPHISYTVLKMK